MQVLFMVGNGFDRACGLNSSYAQFYEWYHNLKKSDREHIQAFRDTIYDNSKSEIWADFESALGKYTHNFTEDNVNKFIDCYDDARRQLIKYLEKEVNRFEQTINARGIREMHTSLGKFYSELPKLQRGEIERILQKDHADEHTLQFISFNYTDILDRCVKELSKERIIAYSDKGHVFQYTVLSSVIHVHGTLQRFPIFGVNDKSQLCEKLLFVRYFAERMLKPRAVEVTDEEWHSEAMNAIDMSTIICIYGMSLGETDAQWFRKILRWLEKDENRHVIIYWYSNDPGDGKDPARYKCSKDTAQEGLLKFAKEGMNIEALRERIHVVENTKKILHIKLTEKNII